MKRSQINLLIERAKALLATHRFLLPPWASWSPEEWQADPDLARWCRDHQLGWDVTDYGEGEFARRGLVLFCIRNGRHGIKGEVPYAEKVLIVGEEQEVPLHYHKAKMEDIIVRAGGNLVFEMYNTDRDGKCLQTDITIRVDGRQHVVKPGAPVILKPGESITIPHRLYHRFYGEAGKGPVLCGEVSQVNDDLADNYFYDSIGRFSVIEEDEKPVHLLWNELPTNMA